MFNFFSLKKRNNYNSKNQKLDNPYYHFVKNFSLSPRRQTYVDPMGRKYFFRNDDGDEEENNEIIIDQTNLSDNNYSVNPLPVQQIYPSPPVKPKTVIPNMINTPKPTSEENITIKTFEKLKNSSNDISKRILSEQQKMNDLELDEMYRIQRHNQVMNDLLRDNIRKKLFLKNLESENLNIPLHNSMKEIHYIYYPKDNLNKLDTLKKENKKLSESLEQIKLEHLKSLNLIKETLTNAIEENEKVKLDKIKIYNKINDLRDELSRFDRSSTIILPIIKTPKVPISRNKNFEKIEQNEEIICDDTEWVKKIIKRDDYFLKRCCEMDCRNEYFRCYGG